MDIDRRELGMECGHCETVKPPIKGFRPRHHDGEVPRDVNTMCLRMF